MDRKAKYIITDFMTLKEVADIAKADAEAMKTAAALRYGKPYCKTIEKTKPAAETWYLPIHLKRSNGITWHLRYYTFGIEDYKANGILFTLYGSVIYQGMQVFIHALKNDEVTIYLPHVMDRYNERLLHLPEVLRTDIAQTFFRRNPTGALEAQPTRQDGIYIVIPDGCLIGTREEGANIVRTYITEDMLRGLQKGMQCRNMTRLIAHELKFKATK